MVNPAFGPQVAPAPKSLRLNPANSIVLLGDSITAYNLDYTLGTTETTDYGYFNHINAQLAGTFDVVHFAGVPGNTTAQMLARFQTDVLAYKPRYMMLLGGTNDYAGGILAVQTITNIVAMVQMATLAGIQVILGLLTPRNDLNATSAANFMLINSFIKQYYKNSDGVWLIDFFTPLADLTTMANSLLAYPLTGVMQDGLHPNAHGAYLMGLEGARVIGPKMQQPNARAGSLRIGASGDQTHVNDNAACVFGTGGTLVSPVVGKSAGLGTGEVTGAPQGWTVEYLAHSTSTLQVSTVPRGNYWTDGRQGSAIRLDVAAWVAADVFIALPNVNYPIAAGTYVLEYEVICVLTAGLITSVGAGNSGITNCGAFINGFPAINTTTFKGTIVSNPFTVGSPLSSGFPFFAPNFTTGSAGYVIITNFVVRPYTPWTPN